MTENTKNKLKNIVNLIVINIILNNLKIMIKNENNIIINAKMN